MIKKLLTFGIMLYTAAGMAQLSVERYSDNGHMTVGVIKYNNLVISATVERPWKDNQVRVSAIPTGEYKIVMKFYGKYHERWKNREGYKGVPMLVNVENRSQILIHPAKHVGHVIGCIGVLSNYWELYKLIEDGDTITISNGFTLN